MPRKKRSASSVPRTIALCYIRQSYTRDASDVDSPERQHANIEAVVARYGFIPEWYQDAEGHKSGRQEKNRPGWLALKARLGDPDVAAVIANDLSRLHRKGWRVGDLIDYLEERGVSLILAAPGRDIDLSSAMGRVAIQIIAMMDEWYAADISARQKDSIAHRKGLGKVIGIPPFGSVRREDGYLKATVKGAWYMPDGSFQAGKATESPDPGAMWRSYYESAKRVLTLYAQNKYGFSRIAYQMQLDGWPFKDRHGSPRRIEADDVRRIVANWPEYGGIVTKKRGKDRHPYEFNYDLNAIPFKPERAIFDIELLRTVAEVRLERTVKPLNDGVVSKATVYPLNGIAYCAHCERLAAEQNNPNLRTRLNGGNNYGTLRYRHKEGVRCGSKNRSVLCKDFEADFSRLIKLLTIRPDALDLLTELSIQADKLRNPAAENAVDAELEKQEAIALCRRRIEAAINLYGDGRLDREEYLRRIEQNEREIAHWEARTTEVQKAGLELAMCMETIDKLARLWDTSEPEDKQGMARSLFSYVTWDLDIRRIVDFRLKPWADRFLVLRAALYEDENGSTEPKNDDASAGQEQRQALPPTTAKTNHLPRLRLVA